MIKSPLVNILASSPTTLAQHRSLEIFVSASVFESTSKFSSIKNTNSPVCSKQILAPHFLFDSDHFITLVLCVPTTYFLSIIETTRLWLISFNLHYLRSTLNEQWKSQIDESFADTNWYLNHKQTFGNAKYAIIAMSLSYIFGIAAICAIYFIAGPTDSYFAFAMIDAVFLLVTTCVVVGIYYHCRKDDRLGDHFFFHYELKYTAAIWLFAIVIVFLSVVCWHSAEKHYKTIGDVLHIIGLIAFHVCPSLLSTLWIPRKIISSGLWDRECSVTRSDLFLRDYDIEQAVVTAPLRDTLRDKKKFEGFIQWMHREFNQESALAFIEMVQAKASMLRDRQSANQEEEEGGGGIEASLAVCLSSQNRNHRFADLSYDAIPKSTTVHRERPNMNQTAKAKDIAHALFEKYIKVNSVFEVNISSGMRGNYVRLDRENWNLETDEFIKVFDAVIAVMISMMSQCFLRYKTRLLSSRLKKEKKSLVLIAN